MRATIDAGGRIVVPIRTRQRLNLSAGAEVELTEHDGWLEVAPVATPVRLVERDGLLVAQAAGEMPTLTQDAVRRALEDGRR